MPMASPVAWLGALERLRRRAFQASGGERISILDQATPRPPRPLRQPELRAVDHERHVEFTVRLTGAQADSIWIYWNEDAQTLTVHAACCDANSTDRTDFANGRDWYLEIPVRDDIDGGRAEAFLKDDALRILAPRVNSKPLTGLPLLAWSQAPDGWSLSPCT